MRCPLNPSQSFDLSIITSFHPQKNKKEAINGLPLCEENVSSFTQFN